MRCPTCHHENRDEAKFCEACGSKLTLACSSCGNQVRPEAVFCDTCGASLKTKSHVAKSSSRKVKKETPSAAARRQTLDPRPTSGERRQLTVMFCDLVGSTALSTRLDPEEWRTVVQDYQRTCAEVIRRFDGYVAQYLGDGLLVYFGYPAAHEDDAQRAVRTSLDIIETLQRAVPSPLAGEGQGEGSVGAHGRAPLQVRIGVHTGLVVVGEIGDGERREQLALGETPNVAARLQGAAEPDTVVVSAATYRLIEGLFDCQDLGHLELKGVATPLQAYRIIGESEQRSRLEVAVLRGLTPLVGREEETALLLRRWKQAKTGEGQVVLLSGEAGIGKSRLTQVLKDHIAQARHARVEWRCSPYHQNSALYPVIEQVQRLLQFGRADSAEEKFRKLEVGARHASPLQADTIPLLASLLSLPLPESYPLLTLTPQRQKQKTLEILLAWLLQEAQHQPVLVVVEDLHWIDPSTLELLSLVVDQISSARVLAVLTFRPDFNVPWSMAAHLTQVSLSCFARRQVEAMVKNVAGEKALSSEVVQQIVEKTDGVPLFVEELTKAVLEDVVGARHAVPLQTIPATLHDSLMARLDRLNSAKEIAQLGATLGREFSYELIHAVSPIGEKDLQKALAKLIEAELLYQRGQPPAAHYTFKHALVQDTAYQSLLKSTRQQHHQRIAQVLEKQFPETKETQPELLAQHYADAGLIEQAIPYWQQAGRRAAQRSAYVEAISHLTKGLELLKTLPDTPERTQHELTLQIALCDALGPVKGFTAREVEKTVTRARELCQQMGETLQLFPVLFRLALFYINRGKLQTARELAEQLMRLAQSVQDRYLLSMAHTALGCTLSSLGELVSAQTHLEQAIALYDPQQHPRPTVNTADPRVDCLSYAARTLWYLGYPNQALKRSQEAVALAEELSHPFSLAYALGSAAWCHQLRREEQVARERAEAVMTLSTEQRFPYWLAWGTVMRGWALAEQGQVIEGMAQMRQSQVTHFPALLAEAYGKVGQVEEGLILLSKALAFVDKNGEQVNEAELYRLKGELTLQSQVESHKSKVEESRVGIAHQGETFARAGTVGRAHPTAKAEAEECFLKAIEVARKQQAKSLELRATVSLARLRQQQAAQSVSRNTQHETRTKLDAARNMLAEIYGWFTEGFDTKDLQEAKTLLNELERANG